MKSKVLSALIILVSVSLAAGCATPIQFVPSSVPVGDKKIKILGEAHGKACVRSFLFIPVGVSSSLHDAYQDALKDIAGTDGILEMSIDTTWFQFPIPHILPLYASACTEVRGKAFKFVRKRR